jgi:hypothetical protein
MILASNANVAEQFNFVKDQINLLISDELLQNEA